MNLVVDVDSTEEDPTHGKQELVGFDGHFRKNCFHLLFAFSSDEDCLRAKIEWREEEFFARIGFIVTNWKLPAGKVVKAYKGRGELENLMEEGKNTLRRDKTSCLRFAANQAHLLMGVWAYNLLHMLRQFYLMGEALKQSIGWLIKRLVKVGARESYHSRKWYVHVASASLLVRHHQAVFG